MKPPAEVFLSHAASDRALADRIVSLFRGRGITVWYSQHDIAGATQWHDEIGQALRQCDTFVLLLTPHAVASKWVKRELLFALDAPQFDGRIVPFLAKPCDHAQLSWTLAAIQFIHADTDFDSGCESILKLWYVKPPKPRPRRSAPHRPSRDSS